MPDDSTRRAAIYARYSSHAQREESISQQVDVCRRWCAAHGYDVEEVYADEARSGRSTDGRDAFLRMVDDARAGAWSVVVVYKLDRFARDRYDAAIYRRRLRDAGVEVRSAMENIPEGPEGRLLEAVVEGVAEWYSADLSQKTMRGMRANAERCMANGVAVFGYSVGPDGRYVVDEAQAAVVRDLFADWARGVPAVTIARRLADAGVRTALGRVPSKNWVKRVVHDERYLGTYVWDDVRVEGGMPALVDELAWTAAHNRPRRPTLAPRRTHGYPLVGRIWDRETGRPMRGHSARGHGGEYTYYEVVCDDGRRGLVRCGLVEGAVVRAVRSALADAALVDDVVARVLEYQRRALDSGEADALRRELVTIGAEEGRLLNAIQAGVALDGMAARADALNSRKRAARAALSRLEADAVTEADVRAAMAGLAEHGSDDAILRHCVAGVVVDRDERAVVVTLPVADKKSANPQGVSTRAVWLPAGGHVSNLAWDVVDGLLWLRVPLAA
jgi:DNA invertase Pin-like site-specific DNA recombinase